MRRLERWAGRARRLSDCRGRVCHVDAGTHDRNLDEADPIPTTVRLLDVSHTSQSSCESADLKKN